MNPMGHILCIAEGKPVDPSRMARKRLSLHWELMFSRQLLNFEPEKHGENLNKIGEWIDQGLIKHCVTKVFPFTLQGLKDALTLQQDGKAIGKISLTN